MLRDKFILMGGLVALSITVAIGSHADEKKADAVASTAPSEPNMASERFAELIRRTLRIAGIKANVLSGFSGSK